jgi:transposase
MSTAGIDTSYEVLVERWRLVRAYRREGYSTAETAIRMGISRRTVTRYRRRPTAPTHGPGPRPWKNLTTERTT